MLEKKVYIWWNPNLQREMLSILRAIRLKGNQPEKLTLLSVASTLNAVWLLHFPLAETSLVPPDWRCHWCSYCPSLSPHEPVDGTAIWDQQKGGCLNGRMDHRDGPALLADKIIKKRTYVCTILQTLCYLYSGDIIAVLSAQVRVQVLLNGHSFFSSKITRQSFTFLYHLVHKQNKNIL